MIEDKELLSLELDHLKNDSRQQELTQWMGMTVTLLLLLAGKAVGLSDLMQYVVPLNFFAVARSDYIIHRNAAKTRAIEDVLGHVGNENMQKAAGSRMLLFDFPLFLGIAVLGRVLSSDMFVYFSVHSLGYWSLCGVTAVMVGLATKLGASHYDSYRNALKG